MKCKKILAVAVAGMMMVGSFSTAYAAKPFKNKRIKGKGVLMVQVDFDDLEDYPWAQKAIRRMADKGIIKGYGNGIFNPNKPVTQLEAITMALRVLGEEDKALEDLELIRSGKKNGKFKKGIQDWSYGYVSVAYEEGIIDEGDIVNLNRPAKRQEVAKYIVRAMDMEDEAQDNMDRELGFVDAASIGDDYVGYVYVASKLGLMRGSSNGVFQANKPITRAEMAVLIERVHDDIDFDEEYWQDEYHGEVVSIDEDDMEISIRSRGGRIRTFDIDKDVEFEGEADDIDDIEEGDYVQVELDKDGKVVEIEEYKDFDDEDFEDDFDDEEFEGEVVSVDEDDMEIRIELEDGERHTFEVDEDVEVEIDGEEADLDDIEDGDYVEIETDEDGKVIEIEVEREDEYADEDFEGEVVSVDEDDMEIRIELEDGERHTFEVDEDVEVEIDGEEADLDDIEDGDYVEIETDEDGKVIEIEVEDRD